MTEKLGVRLIRGYKPLEVINMHDFERSGIDFERSNQGGLAARPGT